MRKKLVLGTILMVSLLIVTVVVAVGPALGNPRDNSMDLYGTGGRVGFSVPTPSGSLKPGFPTYFNLFFWDFDRRSETGAFDMMVIQTWAPGVNVTIPVAIVMDIPAPDWLKKFYNGTMSPIYYETSAGVVRNNIIEVTDKQLEVWMESTWTNYGNGHKSWNAPSDTTLIGNLSTPVQIKGIPALYGLPDFTISPLQIEFHEIAEGWYNEVVGSMTTKGTFVPAWVFILTTGAGMGRGAPLEAVGHLYFHATVSYTLPP